MKEFLKAVQAMLAYPNTLLINYNTGTLKLLQKCSSRRTQDAGGQSALIYMK